MIVIIMYYCIYFYYVGFVNMPSTRRMLDVSWTSDLTRLDVLLKLDVYLVQVVITNYHFFKNLIFVVHQPLLRVYQR